MATIIVLPTLYNLLIISTIIGMAYSRPTNPSISFVIITGGNRTFHALASVSQCVKLNSQIPSAIHLINTTTSRQFKVKAYHSEECKDDFFVKEFPLNAENPVQLNQRKQICSIRMEGASWAKHPTTVRFVHDESDRITVKDIIVGDTECTSLCNEEYQTSLPHYPSTVYILESDGTTSSNFILLFSKPGCADGTQISNGNGDSYKIFSGANIVELTRIDPEKVLNSFMVVAVTT